MTKLVMVETLSQFRMRYVVELPDDAPNYKATDLVLFDTENLKEFSQTHLGEMDLSTRTITSEQYLEMFAEDNDYLKEWTTEKKLSLINKLETE
jgi:lipase chaperone LimK